MEQRSRRGPCRAAGDHARRRRGRRRHARRRRAAVQRARLARRRFGPRARSRRRGRVRRAGGRRLDDDDPARRDPAGRDVHRHVGRDLRGLASGQRCVDVLDRGTDAGRWRGGGRWSAERRLGGPRRDVGIRRGVLRRRAGGRRPLGVPRARRTRRRRRRVVAATGQGCGRAGGRPRCRLLARGDAAAHRPPRRWARRAAGQRPPRGVVTGTDRDLDGGHCIGAARSSRGSSSPPAPSGVVGWRSGDSSPASWR